MKKIIFLIPVLFSSSILRPQTLQYAFTIPWLQSAALHPAFQDAFSASANAAVLLPAGLHAGVYAEKRYRVEGLNILQAALDFSGKDAAGGLQLSTTGFGPYREIHTGAHYTKALGNIHLGVVFTYSRYAVRGYQVQTFAGFGIAAAFRLTDKLSGSLQWLHPPVLRLKSGGSRQEAAEYRTGLGFAASNSVYMGVESIKSEDAVLQVIASIYYRMGEKYMLKAGWSAKGPQPFIAVRWEWKGVRVGVSVTYHPVLGSSPGAFFLFDAKQANAVTE